MAAAYSEHTILDLVRKVQAGDREAGGELIAAYGGLIKWMAGEVIKAKRLPQDRQEDLEQEGAIGVLRAAKEFDFERGSLFATLADKWIRHHINRSESANPMPYCVPAYQRESAEWPGENAPARSDVRDASAADSNDEGRFPAFVVDASGSALGRLSAFDREIISRRLGIGGFRPHTFSEIGRFMGLRGSAGRDRAARHCDAVIALLQGFMAEEFRAASA